MPGIKQLTQLGRKALSFGVAFRTVQAKALMPGWQAVARREHLESGIHEACEPVKGRFAL